jgi:hypothetical protein
MVSAYIFTIGSWSPGIGDPSSMGWLTVYSYYLTAGVCLLKIVRGKRQRSEEIFWGSICFGMVLLGIIKQYNLLSALTEIGRIVAKSGGWLEERGIIQSWAMVVVTGFFILAARRISDLPAKTIKQNMITVLGVAYLILFVIFRGISLHQFGTVLNLQIFGARVNWLAELLGIYWILFSSFWNGSERT